MIVHSCIYTNNYNIFEISMTITNYKYKLMYK